MSTTLTWADHLIIQATANAFNLHIQVRGAAGHEIVTEITPNTGEAPSQIITAIYTGNHYMIGHLGGYRAPTKDELTQQQPLTNEHQTSAPPDLEDSIYHSYSDVYPVQANGTSISEYHSNIPLILSGIEFNYASGNQD